MDNPNEPKLPNFGVPIDPTLLQGFASISLSDVEQAIAWFDKHASPEWVGSLDNKPIGAKKKRLFYQAIE